MKRTYYTTEGKAYILRVSTKNVDALAVAASSFTPRITVNDLTPSTLPYILNINTDKKIVPLICTLSMVDAVAPYSTLVDIVSVFYSMDSNGSNNSNFQKSLLKRQGYVDRLYYTSNNFYAYNLAYSQMLLNDDDFIDVNSQLNFDFLPSPASAFVVDTTQQASIPASSYNICISFLYFEMESKG
jgi:hypothetical protein